jgi:hypothetical protein
VSEKPCAVQWEVIALHHKRGKIGMPKLNGQNGTYAANEGVGIASMGKAIAEVGGRGRRIGGA